MTWLNEKRPLSPKSVEGSKGGAYSGVEPASQARDEAWIGPAAAADASGAG
jgi:hypothetical protein